LGEVLQVLVGGWILQLKIDSQGDYS
jgi:hypothetical protein